MADLTGFQLIGDDFTGYADTAALQAQWDTSNAVDKRYWFAVSTTNVSLDTAVTYNGHASMRYAWPAGSNAGPQSQIYCTNNLVNRGGPSNLTTMWVRFTLKWSPGWDSTGDGTGGDASYKVGGMGWSNYDGRGDFQYNNRTRLNVGTHAIHKVTAANTMVFVTTNFDGAPQNNEWTGADWYDFVVHYEQTSAISCQYRVFRAISGQTLVSIATIENSMVSSAGSYYTNVLADSWSLGKNYNQGRAGLPAQYMYWGRWEIVNGSTHTDPFGVDGGAALPSTPPAATPTPNTASSAVATPRVR